MFCVSGYDNILSSVYLGMNDIIFRNGDDQFPYQVPMAHNFYIFYCTLLIYFIVIIHKRYKIEHMNKYKDTIVTVII